MRIALLILALCVPFLGGCALMNTTSPTEMDHIVNDPATVTPVIYHMEVDQLNAICAAIAIITVSDMEKLQDHYGIHLQDGGAFILGSDKAQQSVFPPSVIIRSEQKLQPGQPCEGYHLVYKIRAEVRPPLSWITSIPLQ